MTDDELLAALRAAAERLLRAGGKFSLARFVTAIERLAKSMEDSQ